MGRRFLFYCRRCHYRHIHRPRRRRPGSFSPIAFPLAGRFRIGGFLNFSFQLFIALPVEVGLCLSALNAAMANTGHIYEFLNTNQGCQFTSAESTSRLLELYVRISMDGKGRWMDNVFDERLWRSVQYEEIYLHEHATIPVLEAGLNRWFHRYNTWSPHQALGNLTPQVACENRPKAPKQPVEASALIAA